MRIEAWCLDEAIRIAEAASSTNLIRVTQSSEPKIKLYALTDKQLKDIRYAVTVAHDRYQNDQMFEIMHMVDNLKQENI